MGGTDLESLLSLYETRIGCMTILVVLGVLGEVVTEAYLHGRGRPWREWLVPAFFGAIVVLGVGGEFWYGGEIEDVSRQLRELSKAESTAATARGEAAKRDATALQLEIERLQEKNLLLASKLGDRVINDDSRHSIVLSFAKFGAQRVRIVGDFSHREVHQFAHNLAFLLQSFRTEIDRLETFDIVRPLSGVAVWLCEGEPDPTTQEAAEAIVALVRDHGYEAKLRDLPRVVSCSPPGPDEARITVAVYERF